jgi:hypothetical protein
MGRQYILYTYWFTGFVPLLGSSEKMCFFGGGGGVSQNSKVQMESMASVSSVCEAARCLFLAQNALQDDDRINKIRMNRLLESTRKLLLCLGSQLTMWRGEMINSFDLIGSTTEILCVYSERIIEDFENTVVGTKRFTLPYFNTIPVEDITVIGDFLNFKEKIMCSSISKSFAKAFQKSAFREVIFGFSVD